MAGMRAACLATSAALHVAALAWCIASAPRAAAPLPLAQGRPALSVTWVAARPVVAPAPARPRRVAAPRPVPAGAVPAPAPAPAPQSEQAPVEVAAQVDAPVSAPPVFAPPAFGGWGGHRRWAVPTRPALADVALLALAQQQRQEAAALAQARQGWEAAEQCRLAQGEASVACAAAATPP